MAGVAVHDEHHGPPRFQHEHLPRLCYFLLGCGFLTGWNALLTATDFFNAAFPGRSIDRVFTIVYLPITLSLVGLVSRCPGLLGGSRSRMLTGYSMFTLCSAAIPVIDAALIRGQQPPPEAAYGLVLLAVALVAVGDGITQGTVYGDAALLPAEYTQATVMGAAASGVIIGTIRIITKGSLPQTAAGLRTSTQIYFAASGAITAVCIALYELLMPRLDVIQHYRGKLQAERDVAELVARRLSEASGSPLSADSCISIAVTGQRLQVIRSQSSSPAQAPGKPHARSAAASPPAAGLSSHCLPSQPTSPGEGAEAACCNATSYSANAAGAAAATPCSAAPNSAVHAALDVLGRNAPESGLKAAVLAANGAAGSVGSSSSSSSSDRQELGPLSWTAVARLNWRLCVAVFVLYGCTLSIFPGFLAENVHSSLLGSWYPVLLIFTFNVTDFVGRCTPDFGWLPQHTPLLLLCLARLVVLQTLYPVFAVRGAGEAVFFVLTAVLGASNGYLTALIFCAAPRGLSPCAAELAGNLNVFCELAGLTVGAFMGWLWTI
ncbi:hypothetical protein OEZ86_002198 [Tetradesmus obliquus]|nr:hypothetical protein OEZ86_002198 [Tetradesmus obliquus]